MRTRVAFRWVLPSFCFRATRALEAASIRVRVCKRQGDHAPPRPPRPYFHTKQVHLIGDCLALLTTILARFTTVAKRGTTSFLVVDQGTWLPSRRPPTATVTSRGSPLPAHTAPPATVDTPHHPIPPSDPILPKPVATIHKETGHTQATNMLETGSATVRVSSALPPDTLSLPPYP